MARNTESCTFSLRKGLVEQIEQLGYNRSSVVTDMLESLVNQNLSGKEELYKKRDELFEKIKLIKSEIDTIEKQIEKFEEKERKEEEYQKQLELRKNNVYQRLCYVLPKLYRNMQIMDNKNVTFGSLSLMFEGLKDLDEVVNKTKIKNFLITKKEMGEEPNDEDIKELCDGLFQEVEK